MNNKNKTSSEVTKIQAILGKDKKNFQEDNHAHYTFEEKCTAIHNWSKSTDIDFDMTFVESVHSSAARYGKPTKNQENAINKIISRYHINVSNWCY